MTLLNFGRIGSLGYYVGTILVCIAMLALAYAAIIFHYRDRLLTHKLTARMLQLELKKQISSEPGALTAARISDIKGSNGAHMATDAGPVTIVDVEPQQRNKGKSLAASAMQARIEKLKHRAKNGLYYDRVGPTLLGGALIVAYAFNFYCKSVLIKMSCPAGALSQICFISIVRALNGRQVGSFALHYLFFLLI